MDYSTLKSLKPSKFEDAARGYRVLGDMASQAKDDIERQVTAGMRKSLKGDAVDEAVVQLRNLAANFQYTQVECALIATALNSVAYELRAAKHKLDAAVEDAAAQHFTVHSDGSVSYPAAGDKVDGKVPEGGTVKGSATGDPTRDRDPIDPSADASDIAKALERQASNHHDNPNYGRALAIANRIAQAVHQATQADEKWAPQLRKLKADDDLVVADEDWADAKKDMGGVRRGAKDYLDGTKAPPKGGSPAENAAWWKGLSNDERDAYIALHPAGLGKLDGLPAAVRDEANRTALAETRAEFNLKLEKLDREEPAKYEQKWDNAGQVPVQGEKQVTLAWKAWAKERAEITEPLKGMDAIQDRFDRTGEDGLPEAYLMGFSAEGRGRAILANGNPDDADHVAVYTPGTGASLSNSNGDINRGVNLWKTSQGMTDQNVSTITWIGYGAPPEVFPDANSHTYADNAADEYGQFIDGLNAANKSGSDSHVTAVAHSYGTTVIGAAAQRGDLGVDDVVFAGSPGARVDNAADLDVGKGHVWNEHAEGDDLVNGFGRFSHGGGVSGIDPSDPIFGANQMTTDTEGHSGYWDYDDKKDKPSLSIEHQGRVIVGEYDMVRLKPRDGGSLMSPYWREPQNWGD
ncbi:alpha/beta hydrolase [Streptomyces sp. RTd22]|uniref:alpha/beta hydrolase n=1 Tax=Streptomyces sp. RTd22 TaxID=1841249 RepID=UPI0007C55A2A|nr:alpha/beta hydrolase [Streptomyces sp. RTd22]